MLPSGQEQKQPHLKLFSQYSIVYTLNVAFETTPCTLGHLSRSSLPYTGGIIIGDFSAWIGVVCVFRGF